MGRSSRSNRSEQIRRRDSAAIHLGGLEENGHAVNSLNWKSPREFRSFTYWQSGFELDRDRNVALNVLCRGLKQWGVVHSEAPPVETNTAVDRTRRESVSARAVAELGSPALTERTA